MPSAWRTSPSVGSGGATRARQPRVGEAFRGSGGLAKASPLVLRVPRRESERVRDPVRSPARCGSLLNDELNAPVLRAVRLVGVGNQWLFLPIAVRSEAVFSTPFRTRASRTAFARSALRRRLYAGVPESSVCPWISTLAISCDAERVRGLLDDAHRVRENFRGVVLEVHGLLQLHFFVRHDDVRLALDASSS